MIWLFLGVLVLGYIIGVVSGAWITYGSAKEKGAKEAIDEWGRQLEEKLLHHKVTQLYPDYKPDTITNEEFTMLLFHYLLIKGHIQITKVGDQKRYTFRYYTYEQHEQTT